MNFLKTTQKQIEKTAKTLTKAIKLKSYRKLAVNFLILTANLLIIILYFTLSEATIAIVPMKETFTHATNLDPLAVSGELVTVDVSHEQMFPVTGGQEVLGQARGQLTITNAVGNRNQTFVANTRFKNDAGVEVKIEKQVALAPGARTTVSAYASKEGKEGEVSTDAGRFQVVALPYLKDQIYAEVTTPFTGGVRTVAVLTQEIYDSARNEVEQALRESAAKQISDIPEGSAPAVAITTLESSAKPNDTDVSQFTLIARGTASVFKYDTARAREIVAQELVKAIPPDKLFVSVDDASYAATMSPDAKTISASMSAQIQPKLPDTALSQEEIVGMNREEVREYFQKITGISDVEVRFWPFWVRSVPNLTDHVN
ncbi:MAG: hypothetical protein HY462_01485, partial [Parcubacteria group bacterium]|nr:hypothetical protein [Parcubacteria group bacterium]